MNNSAIWLNGSLIISNQRVESPDKAASKNPATLQTVGEFSLASPDQCRQAVEAAKQAFPLWRDFPASGKKKIFREAKKILLARKQEIAEIITAEKGSPLAETLLAEIWTALEVLDYYARNAEKVYRPKKARHHVLLFSHKKSSFRFQALGPTLIISPWNYPLAIPVNDIMSALGTGNTAVLRPSSTTAFTALALGEVFMEAGLPPGVLNIVNCKIPQAELMLTSPDIQTIMFTGHTATGKKIMELASRNLTNLTLELGGKDPMIVCADADLEKAAQGAVWGAFTNCGQSCGSIERVYAAAEIADEFTSNVVSLTQKLKVGDPLDPETDLGPMATLSQLEEVKSHITDARQKGARVECGGEGIEGLPGYFIQPTVLTAVDHSMQIMTEETFGPVLPIKTFSSPEEAISLANDSIYGLTASIWTRSRKAAAEMADKIEAGSITVNDHMFSFAEPNAIWGGIKQTGIGRSHGVYGQQELVNIKYTSLDFNRKKSLIWWFPYSAAQKNTVEKALRLVHHSRLREKFKALFALVPDMPEILSKLPLRNFIKNLPRIFSG